MQREGRTGTEFPATYCHISKTDCPLLVGVGSRRKRLLGMKNIDVYSLGFYIDETGTKKLLASTAGQFEASGSNQLCTAVLNASDLEKTIRIVVTSGMVNHDRFVGALKDSLVPACKQEGDTDSLPQFEKLFDGAEFRKGMEMAFTSTKSGGLAARIDNRDVGEVRSVSFSKAFFGLYLGEDPVSKEAKASFEEGLSKLVAHSAEDTKPK